MRTWLTGGRCFVHGALTSLDVAIEDGRIAELGTAPTGAQSVSVSGLTVLPGVIDSQVHFREPGLTHKEDLQSGTAAAALGGVTAIFEMPNTKPSTTTREALLDKFTRARGRAWVDHAFFIGAAAENARELAELERIPGCAGVKVFLGSSTGSLLVDDPAVLREVLRSGRRRVAVHAEHEARLLQRKPLTQREGVTAHAHPEWRDAESARMATERVLQMARETGRPLHVLHVTTADELPLLAAYRDVATVEMTPQHLSLSAPDCYDRLGTLAQMNPPIRDAAHQAALWRAVQQGLTDVIGSDHAPHTLEEKAAAYPNSPSGMPGVQTLVPLMLEHVHAGRLSLERFVELTSQGPARVYGVARKGRIAQGYDADFTVVDLGAEHTLRNADMASRTGWTPFDGMRVHGRPVMTVVRGQIVMREGELLEQPCGQPVQFHGALPGAEA